MALVKQAQPALNTRFAKHLLVMTSGVVDAGDVSLTGSWTTNAVGYEFNPNYGFGLIDAAELTTQATQFSGVTALQTASTGSVAVNEDDSRQQSRRCNGYGGNCRRWTAGGGIGHPCAATHTYRGDLEAYLTSPMGTTNRLMIKSESLTARLISIGHSPATPSGAKALPETGRSICATVLGPTPARGIRGNWICAWVR